jgi:FtsP/CotA-like multicopper oxidase with cupredoxin domain
MKPKVLLSSLIFFMILGCQDNSRQVIYNSEFIRSRNIACETEPTEQLTAGIFSLASYSNEETDINHQRYLPAGKPSGLPSILPNDNRRPAGIENEGILNLNLEVKWGDFRMETMDRPGLKMVAVGEVGKEASIPSPLIRVKEGSSIRARITNTLADSTITVYGLQKRPYTKSDSLFILPGKTGEVTFEAGDVGTYLYWIQLGKGNKIDFGSAEDEQLAGAFIVDPKEGHAEDRVFVINVFSNKNDTEGASPEWVEAVTINGRSWPFTERLKPSVGDLLTWKVINASNRGHPMHLHGFYFDVLERGNTEKTDIFTEDQKKLVVTENLYGKNTMTMQWVPKRPGNWLFHCHLSFHVSSMIRLPGAELLDPEGTQQHMAGLVLGIQVKDGESDLFSKGEERNLTLFAHQADKESMSLNSESNNPEPSFKPGPLLLLKQYQTTRITVKNQMSLPTSIHWHGLEIDSWSDGVANWSSSDGRTSPIIEPGEEFTYKLSLMRAGTFVYHSHLNDINQLTKGMYGPMIVLGENEVYQPDLDHYFILGWKTPDIRSQDDLDLNGWDEIPVQQAKTGETHRLRLINIGPAGDGNLSFTKNGNKIPVKTIAKDGADLPISQQIDVEETTYIGVGETSDFSFTPEEPGTYELHVKYIFGNWTQIWEVSNE